MRVFQIKIVVACALLLEILVARLFGVKRAYLPSKLAMVDTQNILVLRRMLVDWPHL